MVQPCPQTHPRTLRHRRRRRRPRRRHGRAAAAARGTVLLVEHVALPRDKSCGGMLNEYTQEFLAPFGEVPDEIILDPEYVNFRYLDWDRGIRKPTATALPQRRPAGLRRLARLAAARQRRRSSERRGVVGFEQDDDGVRVTLKNGRRARRVALREPRRRRRRALRRCDGTLGVGSVATYVTLQDFCALEGAIEPYFDCIYMRDIGDCVRATPTSCPRATSRSSARSSTPRRSGRTRSTTRSLDILREALPARRVASSARRGWRSRCGIHDDVVPGRRAACCSPARRAASCRRRRARASPTRSTPGSLAGTAIADSDPASALAALRAPRRATSRATSAASSSGCRSWSRAPASTSPASCPTPIVSRITKGL